MREKDPDCENRTSTEFRLIRFGRFCAWMLIILIATYFLSGFGITKSSLINKSTFGLLDKASSFRIHEYLTLPMAFAFLCHTLIAIRFAMIRWKVKNKIVLNYLLTGIGIILFSLAAYAYFI